MKDSLAILAVIITFAAMISAILLMASDDLAGYSNCKSSYYYGQTANGKPC